MQNDLLPQKYTKQGLSPLHLRVMKLFHLVEDFYHCVWMDDLYNLAAFCKVAWNHPKYIFIAGVTRKGVCGIPLCVWQDEIKNKVEQQKVRGTVKAAVLKNNQDFPNHVACSIYDSKPVHFFSMLCSKLQRSVNLKPVYNMITGAIKLLDFLQLNTIHDYNMNICSVDLVGQLQL